MRYTFNMRQLQRHLAEMTLPDGYELDARVGEGPDPTQDVSEVLTRHTARLFDKGRGNPFGSLQVGSELWLILIVSGPLNGETVGDLRAIPLRSVSAAYAEEGTLRVVSDIVDKSVELIGDPEAFEAFRAAGQAAVESAGEDGHSHPVALVVKDVLGSELLTLDWDLQSNVFVGIAASDGAPDSVSVHFCDGRVVDNVEIVEGMLPPVVTKGGGYVVLANFRSPS